MGKDTIIHCPVCKSAMDLVDEFDAYDIDVGLVFFCPECDAELEIVKKDPIVIEKVEYDDEDEDDWGDDDNAEDI